MRALLPLSFLFYSFTLLPGEAEYVKGYLKRGTHFRFEVTSSGSVPKYYSTLEIIYASKRSAGFEIRAEISESDDQQVFPTLYAQFYACDTNSFYAFTHNWFKPVWDPMSTRTYDFAGDSLSYPFRMKVGDSLDGGNAFMQGLNAPPKWGSYLTVSDRKVVKLDTLSLPIGAIPAYLITAKTVRYEREGQKEVSKSGSEVSEWFSPVYGIVQTEIKHNNGQYTRMLLQSIR